MDATPSYHVIFNGQLRAGFEAPQVKQALAERMKLSSEKVERLFSGKPQVIKRTASAAEAKKLVALLASLGAIARIHSEKGAGGGKKQAEAVAKPAERLPRFSPYPRGGALIAGDIHPVH